MITDLNKKLGFKEVHRIYQFDQCPKCGSFNIDLINKISICKDCNLHGGFYQTISE